MNTDSFLEVIVTKLNVLSMLLFIWNCLMGVCLGMCITTLYKHKDK